jgi:hypothetical protein
LPPQQRPLDYVLHTLLQANYNILNQLPTAASGLTPQQALTAGVTPESLIVATMLAAGNVAMSSFGTEMISIHRLKQALKGTYPTSGSFTRTLCNQLFNNTTAVVKLVTTTKSTSTTPTRSSSSSTSQPSRESLQAVAAYRHQASMLTPMPLTFWRVPTTLIFILTNPLHHPLHRLKHALRQYHEQIPRAISFNQPIRCPLLSPSF